MFFSLILVYFLSLFFVFFDLNILFINEEFLIFICMSILFFLLFSSARKFVNFSFFLRIEFIYFFFIYLITLNIKLIDKMMNLVTLENSKMDTLVISELYNFFSESVSELLNSEKLINLFLTKNIILLMNSNIFTSFLLPFSGDFSIKYFLSSNNNLTQTFELKDIGFFYTTKKSISNHTYKTLISSTLYEFYTKENYQLNLDSLHTSIDNTDLTKLISTEDTELMLELGSLNKNIIFNLILS